jgi:O-antigen/teichoic acid export membrane protein
MKADGLTTDGLTTGGLTAGSLTADGLPVPRTGSVPLPARLVQFLIDSVRRRLQESRFMRNVSALFAGTVLAQVASLAVWPLLSRLYRPEEFGVLGVYLGLLTVLITVASLRYEMAIPIARTDREAFDLLAICALGLILTTSMVAVATYVVPDTVLAWFGLLAIAPYRFLVPFGFAWIGAYAALVSFATREADFVTIARTRVTQAFTGPPSQVALALAHAGTWGLLLGFLIAQSSGTMMLYRVARAKLKQAAYRVSLRGLAATMHQFRHFPLISTWGALAEAVGGAMALYLLIGAFYSTEVAGFLFLNERVVGRPLSMVSAALTPVAFSEAGRSVHTDPARLRRRFLQVILRYSIVAAALLAAVNIVAAWLFPLVFSMKWDGAVPYARALTVWYFFATISRSSGPLLLVMGKQVLSSITQIAGPACGAIAFVICGSLGMDPLASVWAYCLCQGSAAAAVIPITLIALRKFEASRAAAEPV